MRVLKFGGTSLKNSEKFLSVYNIIKEKYKKEQVAIVLSAPAKITNYLVKTIEYAISKNIIDIKKIRNIFFKLINDLKCYFKKLNHIKIYKKIKNKLNKLEQLLYGIKIFKFCPDIIQAKIISIGEKISIIIMSNILIAKNYKVTIINPIKYIISTGKYLESTVNIKKSMHKIKNKKIPIENIVLMAGFIAGNKKKELVLLGRNGSDYSAAILSVLLKASCCEIWTDVDGIYSTDPKNVVNAKLIKNISYKEALKLSFFGAKVIHPKMILPLLKFNIPCLIKNTLNIFSKGTLINNFNEEKKSIKGVSYLNNVSMFNLTILKNKKLSYIYSKLFSIISLYEIILVSLCFLENKIVFFTKNINVKKIKLILEKTFFLEINNKILKKIKIINNLSIISIIGNNINSQFVKIHKIIETLRDNFKINILYISQYISKNSISIVIKNKNIKNNINNLHQSLFDNFKIINVFLIGVGGVGETFLEQVKSQKNILIKKKVIINICYIANSKSYIFNYNGINLKTWKKKLIYSKLKFKIEDFIFNLKKYRLNNSVFIDCTNSDELAYEYSNILLKKYHIVTPNKKANTFNFEYYKKIRKSSDISNKKFLYDTNIGAGLPVIDTIQNLLNTGDKLIKFRGILSGSLSFIFGKLDDGFSLSESTKKAIELGFTEPNPQDDLLGLDVARKLLILAREVGYKLELKDIKIEPIIPKKFYKNVKKESFIKNLKKLDVFFEKKINKARKKGKVLRYVGKIESDGICKLSIDFVKKSNPLYEIKNGENALAFYTKYYNPIPLVIKGYGAGKTVTSAGIFSDLLKIKPCKWGF
ncbi:bifunctional aspartate kinase/homoserine dehydrogenase I [Buchnera aphidicola (Taiwanaphis decaspermi)]|uniref:bifunctional aspartate kinase/homoserine dehydrogenase I n=1 Tax=Buchnera aphidicola TaxID=9 RepID=UPI0031B86186